MQLAKVVKTGKPKKRVKGCKVFVKHISGDGGKRQRKEYGANSLFFKKKISKTKNRKKIKFWRQKDEELGIFPDV